MNLLGKNWKGIVGAIGVIAYGLAQLADCVVPDILEQESTISEAIAVIAAGLSALGIRDAVGRANAELQQGN